MFNCFIVKWFHFFRGNMTWLWAVFVVIIAWLLVSVFFFDQLFEVFTFTIGWLLQLNIWERIPLKIFSSSIWISKLTMKVFCLSLCRVNIKNEKNFLLEMKIYFFWLLIFFLFVFYLSLNNQIKSLIENFTLTLTHEIIVFATEDDDVRMG